jgi:predicted metal-dependent peptidase
MQVDKDKALNRAKIALMSRPDSVFLSTILFSLDFHWDSVIPTACTDGITLKVNPDWFVSLSENKRVGLLAHEAWHVAFQHMIRGMGLDPVRFNKAADYVINNMLISQGFELPDGGLWDKQYNNMSTEQVYALLPVSDPNDPYDCDVIYGDDGSKSDEEIAAIEEKVTSIILKAATQSKIEKDKAGTIPGEIEELIEALRNPLLPWNIILQNYMSEYAKEDYSYRIPNRKYFPEFYLPSMYSESITNIAVAVDASGSVRSHEFSAFLSEIEDFRVNLQPKSTTIIGFDTKIVSEVVLTESDSIDQVKFIGRGGTNLSPVFNHFDKNPPTVLIVFSDLDCEKITKAPEYDVIWICVNNPKATVDFGKLIHITI